MARRKPDRAELEDRLRAAYSARGAATPGVEELDLLHQLGEAYGCFSPRRLEKARELYEQALRVLWDADGAESLRAMPILASWLDCARVQRQRLSPDRQQMLDISITSMRSRAEALLERVEPMILSGHPGASALFSGAYVLLQRLGEERRALELLHATTPNWAPR